MRNTALNHYYCHPDFKLVLEKAEEPEIKLPTSTGSWKKQESSRKNIYFCFIDCAKAFDSVDHNKLWKILREMRIPNHLTCLLRNLYAGQEAIVRTGHGTIDWFQIGKGVCLPGSSPGGSRVIRRWGRSRRPGKNLFNYRYRGRLETDSVVGELVEKRG